MADPFEVIPISAHAAQVARHIEADARELATIAACLSEEHAAAAEQIQKICSRLDDSARRLREG